MGLAGTGRRHGHWLEARSHVSCGTLSACPLQCCCCGQEHKSLDGWKAQPSDAAADADEEGFATPPCNLPIIAEEHRGTVCHHACNVAKLQHATERRDVQHKALRALHDMQHATPPVAPDLSSHVTHQVACCAAVIRHVVRCRPQMPRCGPPRGVLFDWCADPLAEMAAEMRQLGVATSASESGPHATCNMPRGSCPLVGPWTPRVTPAVRHVARCRGAARGTPRHVSHSGVACHGCDGRRRLPHG